MCPSIKFMDQGRRNIVVLVHRNKIGLAVIKPEENIHFIFAKKDTVILHKRLQTSGSLLIITSRIIRLKQFYKRRLQGIRLKIRESFLR